MKRSSCSPPSGRSVSRSFFPLSGSVSPFADIFCLALGPPPSKFCIFFHRPCPSISSRRTRSPLICGRFALSFPPRRPDLACLFRLGIPPRFRCFAVTWLLLPSEDPSPLTYTFDLRVYMVPLWVSSFPIAFSTHPNQFFLPGGRIVRLPVK